ncbi:MAG: ABC transporter ATP-binding protein [Spirochaetales bacterium]|nr:ABC transporter ATP-binding protein [Spirochaetales bacterium]
MTDYIIRVKNLEKNYGITKAVDGVSFNIERGKLVSILGPNGAGKTTSLECMEGILRADGGSIEINGEPLGRSRRGWTDGRVGIQLQSSALPSNLTVDEAMRLFCGYRGIPARTDLLVRFGLHEKLKTQYCNLSTGQKRRLSLALAIIHNPEILFLDEPTAGLDVQSRLELHKIIGELKAGGTTVILATHDMAEAESLSDRIIILLHGRVAAEGSPVEITATGSSLSRITVQTEKQTIAGLSMQIPEVESFHHNDDYSVLFSRDIEKTISALLKTIKREDDRLIDLRIERPSLEERFVEITNGSGQIKEVVS